MRSYESLKKKLLKAHSEFSPRKDSRKLTSDILKKESRILKEVFRVLSPIIKFLDKRIIITDNIFTDYYSFSTLYTYELDLYELDLLSTLEDKPTFKFKEVEFDTSTPREKHITEYYKEYEKIIKGIIISMDIIKDETRYFGEQSKEDKSHNMGYNYNIMEESSTTVIEIYLLRSGKILKFDKFRHNRYLIDYEQKHSLQNPQELSIERFLQYDSSRSVINNILLTYHRAIAENENRFPILKKSLEAILEIKERNSKWDGKDP